MKNLIKHELLNEQDIVIEHERMSDGEDRFRIKTEQNSMVCFNRINDEDKWQNAHYHKETRELYVVQSGKVILAIQGKNNKVVYNILNEGETYMVEPGIKHNIFLKKGASTCVIKYGNNIEKDWFAAPKLDLICKNSKQTV